MPGVTMRDFDCSLCQKQFSKLAGDLFIPAPDVCDECLRRVWEMEEEELALHIAESLAELSSGEELAIGIIQVVHQYREQWGNADEAIQARR